MERSSFFNARETSPGVFDRVYKAEEFAEYFSKFVSNGVYPNPSTNLQVVQNDTPDMTTVLMPGAAFINGYTYINDAKVTFSHKVADGVLNRKDAIFIRFDNAGRMIGSLKMEGTPGVDAVVPSIVRTTDYYDLCVSVVNIPAGATKITQDMIEDTRLSTDLCGIVHTVVDHIDTETLYKQIQADLERFRNVSQAEFDAWFEDINAKLDDEPATALQKQVDEINNTRAYLYKVTFEVDNWGSSSPYTQTAVVTPVDGGPPVTADMILCSGFGVDDTLPEAAYSVQLKAAALLGKSRNKVFGAGTMTLTVTEKPSADAEIYFMAKKGGA